MGIGAYSTRVTNEMMKSCATLNGLGSWHPILGNLVSALRAGGGSASEWWWPSPPQNGLCILLSFYTPLEVRICAAAPSFMLLQTRSRELTLCFIEAWKSISGSDLDSPLQISPISLGTQGELLKCLWNLNICEEQICRGQVSYDAYFAYYTE